MLERRETGEERGRWTPEKRAALFTVVTFAITWALEFGVIWPIASGSSSLSETGDGSAGTTVYVLVACMMVVPAIGVLLTRLITREGMCDAWFKPVRFKRTWKWWIAAWLGTIALVAVGALVYFIAFPGDFDPSMSVMMASMQQLLEQQGMDLPESAIRTTLYAQLVSLLVIPAVNIVPAFGEEWGWRGYLLPKLLGRFNVVPALLIMGLIWGLWHLPLILMGHNYGLGYAGYPFTGIVAMCWMCCCLGVFLAYLTLRTGSCIPAALAHGFVNGCASLGLMFSASGGDAFVGPATTGVLGSIGFAVVSAVILVTLRRRERAGLPISACEIGRRG